jgi:hypothetical protein
MKEYPSIPRATGTLFREIPDAYIFDKLDGSSLRSEWNPKRGWYKHGRRHGLLDDSNPSLGVAPELFEQRLAEPLARIARDNRWQSLIVFYEFWGVKSLGGQHAEDDPKFLTLFDAAANKKGILGPAEFLRVFDGKVETASFLGRHNWTRGYVEDVREGRVEGITSEGVVAKAGSGHAIVRAKAKTQAWIDRIIAVHGEIRGRKIVES